MNFYGFCKIAAQINLKKTLAKSLGTPTASHTRQPEADRWGPRANGPPRPSQGEAGLDRGVGAPTASCASRSARARACAATASGGGGAKRRNGAGPERERGGAHGNAEVAAWLTSGACGRGAAAEERHDEQGRRRTVALAGGSAGRERWPG
jgi:hypothetical protein